MALVEGNTHGQVETAWTPPTSVTADDSKRLSDFITAGCIFKSIETVAQFASSRRSAASTSTSMSTRPQLLVHHCRARPALSGPSIHTSTASQTPTGPRLSKVKQLIAALPALRLTLAHAPQRPLVLFQHTTLSSCPLHIQKNFSTIRRCRSRAGGQGVAAVHIHDAMLVDTVLNNISVTMKDHMILSRDICARNKHWSWSHVDLAGHVRMFCNEAFYRSAMTSHCQADEETLTCNDNTSFHVDAEQKSIDARGCDKDEDDTN